MSILSNSILDSVSRSSGTMVFDKGIPYSSKDLLDRSNYLIHLFSEMGARRGDKVIIYMRRSFECISVVLASIRLGLVYVPVDIKTPDSVLKSIFVSIDPVVVACDSPFLSSIPDEYRARSLADFYPRSTEKETVYPDSVSKELDPIYIIHTSGSTGTPKGVLVTHSNVLNHISWLSKKLNLSSNDVFSFNSPLAFDFSVATTILPLYLGGTIVITDEVTTVDIPSYCRQLRERGVTFVKWTPSYFEQLLNYVGAEECSFPKIRNVLMGGEKLSSAQVVRWLRVNPSHVVINEYGPTETTVAVSAFIVNPKYLHQFKGSVPIGFPSDDTFFYVVDGQGCLVPDGELGELWVGGASVSLGYYKDPERTKKYFIRNPFSDDPGQRVLYKTGDLVRKIPNSGYLYESRVDKQIKVRGYRVDACAVESEIVRYGCISRCVVCSSKNGRHLECFLIPMDPPSFNVKDLNNYLADHTPDYMIPYEYYVVDHFPVNKNGKTDIETLRCMVENKSKDSVFSQSSEKDFIMRAIQKHSHVSLDSMSETFFDMGMTSLGAMDMVNDLRVRFPEVTIRDIFEYPTSSKLIDYILAKNRNVESSRSFLTRDINEPIAIIAMDCRLPQASNCEALWDLCFNSILGYEVERIEGEEDSYSVHARGAVDGIDFFDPKFFGMTPKEANLTDPQHRLMIELSWNVLEMSGYRNDYPDKPSIGVFLSSNNSTYLLDHDLHYKAQHIFEDDFSLRRLASSHFISTKVSHLLGCTGPSLSIQTACSSSLVSIALACQQLRGGHCDIAIAGGVSILTPQDKPYTYQKGNIYSPDGLCRPFDEKAEGTVFSNGVGVVLLKKLSDAVSDGDRIISVIKGCAINNDGGDKMSYASPSVTGQSRCIEEAINNAHIESDSISYIEAHGTGTAIGDPIEIESLARAFNRTSRGTSSNQFCPIGSIKANIGHTHAAAGVAGLIKTSLMIEKKTIPVMPNVDSPSKKVDWRKTPFFVNLDMKYWDSSRFPRRAGVSSFGVGGTNAHLVIEEPPCVIDYPTKKSSLLFLFSAKSKQSLSECLGLFSRHLKRNQGSPICLADCSYMLQTGRASFRYRASFIASSISEAITKAEHKNNFVERLEEDSLTRVFLFPGQGEQYFGMSRHLYMESTFYRETLSYCLSFASSIIGMNLKEILFSDKPQNILDLANRTEIIHPILFSVEYSIGRLLMHLGIVPDIVVGHSLGEYAACCLSEAIHLDDCIRLVCARGIALSNSPKGSMISVPLSEDSLSEFLSESVQIAAVNAKNRCTLSGKKEEVDRVVEEIKKSFPMIGERIKYLDAKHPFHTSLLLPFLSEFESVLDTISFHDPKIKYLSGVTGEWVSEELISANSYWLNHITKEVNFLSCSDKIRELDYPALFNVGPSSILSYLIEIDSEGFIPSFQVIPSKGDIDLEDGFFEKFLGDSWCQGLRLNWKNYWEGELRRKALLPTYAFDRKSFWYDKVDGLVDKRDEPHDPFPKTFKGHWVESRALDTNCSLPSNMSNTLWVIFSDRSIFQQLMLLEIQKCCGKAVLVFSGDSYSKDGDSYTVNYRDINDYHLLAESLSEKSFSSLSVFHLSLSHNPPPSDQHSSLDNSDLLLENFYTGLYIYQSLFRLYPDLPVDLCFVSKSSIPINRYEPVNPFNSCIEALVKVIPIEDKNYNLSFFDVDFGCDDSDLELYVLNVLSLATNKTTCFDRTYCFRRSYLWERVYLENSLYVDGLSEFEFKDGSVFLITGGLGGMGLSVIDFLSQKGNYVFVLVSRRGIPTGVGLPEGSSSNSFEGKEKIINRVIERGSKVVIKMADVSSYSDMFSLTLDVERDFSRIDNVFHFAGIPGDGIAALKKKESISDVIKAKVQGSIVLCDIFKGRVLNCFVASSSLTSIVGGFGHVDYCAANIFIDSFFSGLKPSSWGNLLVVNWNSWREVGMAVGLSDSSQHEDFYRGNSISPDEGCRILSRLISLRSGHSIVSHLSPKREWDRIREEFSLSPHHSEGISSSESMDILGVVRGAWADALGCDISTEDDFYSLGGDSLSAIKILNRIGSSLGIQMSLQDFLYPHTISSMASLISCKPMKTKNIIVPMSPSESSDLNRIYFVHPLGGSVVSYFSLLPYLDSSGSYFAIQDPELSGLGQSFSSLGDMACCYVDEILKDLGLIKDGRIILIGASFGGNIINIMVGMLGKKGIPVDKVLLIDSWANMKDSSSLQETHSLLAIKEFYGERSKEYQLVKERSNWLRHTDMEVIDCPVYLLKPEKTLLQYKEIDRKDNGWLDCCTNEVKVRTIKGDHDTMLSSANVKQVAEVINRIITE